MSAVVSIPNGAAAAAENVHQVSEVVGGASVPLSWPLLVNAIFQGKRRLNSGSRGIEHVMDYGKNLVQTHNLEDTFYVYDLRQLFKLARTFQQALPRICIYYSVKSNADPKILKVLNLLGAGFNCCTAAEIEAAMKAGAAAPSILLSQPYKRSKDFSIARRVGVQLTFCDCASEMHKIAVHQPGMKVLIRIDVDCESHGSSKYGATMDEAQELLMLSQELGVNIVGIAFHVLKRCIEAHDGQVLDVKEQFEKALKKARILHDVACKMNINCSMLSIGGGFSAEVDKHNQVSFGGVEVAINAALDLYFPKELGIKILAEPGQFFAKSIGTLFTPIIGVRSKARQEYFITDGIFGSFKCIHHDNYQPTVKYFKLSSNKEDDELRLTTIWGPTTDAVDCVLENVLLPKLHVGDWLMFPDMGAYTVAAAGKYSGMMLDQPAAYYMI